MPPPAGAPGTSTRRGGRRYIGAAGRIFALSRRDGLDHRLNRDGLTALYFGSIELDRDLGVLAALALRRNAGDMAHEL